MPALVLKNSKERILTETNILHLKRKTSESSKKSGVTKSATNYTPLRRTFSEQGSVHPAPHKKTSVATGAATRAAAAMAIAAVENGRSLTKTLPFYLKNMDGRDRALVQEIVYGTLRHRRLLSERLKDLLEHSIVKRYENSRALLLCALYQIVFTRIPPHAVVASTVGACQSCRCRNMTSLVNAVLRRFLREGASLNEEFVAEDIRYSVPKWLYDKLKAQYPHDINQILQAQNEHAPCWLRVENSKISTDAYQKLLKPVVASETIAFAPAALKLENAVGTEHLPKFQNGFVSVQDLAAQMAAPLVEPRSGEKILDCCAAPGGKSAHLMDLCPDIYLISADTDAERLESAQRNFSRLGRSPICKVCDFASDEAYDILGCDFDKILLDAPCSGTGVIRRHPDIKWLRREKDIDQLVSTQAQMLDRAVTMLKPGGLLIYTTCSILQEENKDQVEALIKRCPDIEYYPFEIKGTPVNYYQQLPGNDGADGFFYARFKKRN